MQKYFIPKPIEQIINKWDNRKWVKKQINYFLERGFWITDARHSDSGVVGEPDTVYLFTIEKRGRVEVSINNKKRIFGDVIKKGGKALVVQKILYRENLSYDDCVIIADDRNNAPIFFENALKIGLNPDFLIIVKSDHVVKGSLHEVLSVLQGKKEKLTVAEKLFYKLVQRDRPIVAVLREGNLVFEIYTVSDEDISEIARAISEVMKK